MCGKVQFEIQKLLDTYVSKAVWCKTQTLRKFCLQEELILLLFFTLQRSHIFKTITSPSEALLKDLRTVEVYNYLLPMLLKILSSSSFFNSFFSLQLSRI